MKNTSKQHAPGNFSHRVSHRRRSNATDFGYQMKPYLNRWKPECAAIDSGQKDTIEEIFSYFSDNPFVRSNEAKPSTALFANKNCWWNHSFDDLCFYSFPLFFSFIFHPWNERCTENFWRIAFYAETLILFNCPLEYQATRPQSVLENLLIVHFCTLLQFIDSADVFVCTKLH